MTDHTIVLYDHDKSPADLVAEAIALCEREIKEWREVIPLGVGDNENYAPTQLNSWLTHKAEFEEHYNNFVEGNYNLAESVEGWFCQGCYERNESDTPCRELVTKAKRLLGRE